MQRTPYPLESSFSKGAWHTILSSIFLAFGYLTGKLGTGHFPFFFLVFARYGIGFLIVIPVLASKGKLLNAIRTKKPSIHLLRGLIVTFSQCLLFLYLMYGSLLGASLFMNLAPLYIPFIEKIAFRRDIGLSTYASMFLSVIGVYFLLSPSLEVFKGVGLLGLLSGFLWAVSQVIYGHNVRREKREVNVFYLFATCTFFSGILVLLDPFVVLESMSQEPTSTYLVLLLLALFTVLSQYFRGLAYHYYHPSALSPFLYISILLSGICDWFFFDKPPTQSTILGAFLIILAGGVKVGLRSYLVKKRDKL